MGHSLLVVPGRLSLGELRLWMRDPGPVTLEAAIWPRVEAAAPVVERAAASEKLTYGVNTGFGKLARRRIDAASVAALQRNLVLSHAAGTGEVLPDAVVRLVLLLKVASLALGYSGVRRATVESLLALLNDGILPVVPSQGSVGASGDLAPLAHVALVLIGEGEARLGGVAMPAAEALARAGLAPVVLGAKEGLALLNGTQVSTALALAGLFAAEDCLAASLIAGALSCDAVLGSDVPFAPALQAVRGQPGQARVAAVLAGLIAASEIRASHLACERVQDPYSIRCQPQVAGACLDLLDFAAATLHREANGVCDNPIVFADTGEILSGGNFHAEPVAFAADNIALALAELGAIAERRVALLMDPAMSGLPAFLVAEPGLNSGLMIAQVTAAALAAENKLLAHPASVDSLPTSANQEDHVSMATHGARRLLAMAANTAGIVAVELLAAGQGIEFRRPLRSSEPLEAALALLRALVPPLDRDRILARDIAAARALAESGSLIRFVPPDLLPSNRIS
jgi:histidine ammonia-lyase